ncbi:MAG: agmatine deiminase family protein, partial [Acutalibacteraceae bacterium]
HADGMVRFVDENTVIGNKPMSAGGLEYRIKNALKRHSIRVIDFPYFELGKNSAVGCYLNFLETEKHIFLPVFGNTLDNQAISEAQRIFGKPVAAVNISEIATQGGCLNCIAWEM